MSVRQRLFQQMTDCYIATGEMPTEVVVTRRERRAILADKRAKRYIQGDPLKPESLTLMGVPLRVPALISAAPARCDRAATARRPAPGTSSSGQA